MTTRRLLPLVSAAVLAFPAAAQQQAQHSQYMNNNFVLNPGVAGTEDYVDIKLSHRRQWVGLEGAPRTFYASAHAALGPVGQARARTLRTRYRGFHALGGLVYRDETGPTSRTGLYATYAYNMPFTRKLRGALGVSLGAQQFAVDGTQLRFRDPGEPMGSVATMVPDAIVGVWLYTPELYVGASAGQLFGNRLDFSYQDAGGQATATNRLQRHYFLTGGLRVPLSTDWDLVPSVLVKAAQPAPLSVDVNAKLKYRRVFWLGASWRAFDSFAVLGGVSVKRFALGYAYDAGISGLRSYHAGSHEVLIGLRLSKHNKVVCPDRFW